MLIKEFNSSWTWLRQSDVLNINLSSWGRGQWVSKEYSLLILTFISLFYSPSSLYEYMGLVTWKSMVGFYLTQVHVFNPITKFTASVTLIGPL